MRDAFGGTFMLKLFLVFIFVYICFTAVALNYAKAFKVKNAIISYLENEEISSLKNLPAEKRKQFSEYIDQQIIGNMNYNMSNYNICNNKKISDDVRKEIAICEPAGIIIKEAASAKNTDGVYYTVSTFLGWDLGFLKSLASLNGNNEAPAGITGVWKISGQTRVIVNNKK